jgi:hypothetical protein
MVVLSYDRPLLRPFPLGSYAIHKTSGRQESHKPYLAYLAFPLSGPTETGYRAVMMMTVA